MDTSAAVLEVSRREDPAGAYTVPLPSQTSGNQRGALRGAARGLMMTPWFAAASGFVIAASLWIYSPHAHLQFPNNSAVRVQHCHKRCVGGDRHKGSGSHAASGKGALAGSGTRDPGRAAVSGLTFSYFVLPGPDGRFTIRISVTGKRAIKDWRLAFVLRGDRIRSVLFASWHRTSPDSGTASGTADQAGKWPWDGQDGHGQFGWNHQQYGFTFYVSGAGRPVPPTSCRYDGQACAFKRGWEGHPGTG